MVIKTNGCPYYSGGHLIHYGVGADDNPPGRGSGRYPKGSGERPNQHDGKKKSLFSVFRKKSNEEPSNSIDKKLKLAAAETFIEDKYKFFADDIRKINADPEYAAVKKEMEEKVKIFDEYNSKTNAVRDDCAGIAAVYDIEKYWPTEGEEDKGIHIWAYKYEDLDQGTPCSEQVFLVSKGFDPYKFGTEFNNLYTKLNAEFEEAARRIYGDDLNKSYSYNKKYKDYKNGKMVDEVRLATTTFLRELRDANQYNDWENGIGNNQFSAMMGSDLSEKEAKELIDWYKKNGKRALEESRKIDIYHSGMQGKHLAQSGILGMKWGIRRFQNPDGSLTEEGKKRYGKTSAGKLKVFSKKRAEVQEKVKEEKAKPLTKDEIIRSGDINTILNNAKELSANDLTEAMNRINKLNDFKKMKLDEQTRNQPRIKRLLKKGADELENIMAKDAAKGIETLTKAGATIAGKKIIDGLGLKDETADILRKAIGVDTSKEIAKKERDKTVEALIKSGDPEKILKNANKLTNEELKQALNRVSNVSAIKKLSEPKKEQPDNTPILRSGDLKEILKNAPSFSDTELKSVGDRASYIATIKKLIDELDEKDKKN